MKIILKLLFMLDFWLGVINLKNANHLKNITKELMPVAWHPTNGGIGACQKMTKKELDPIFTDKVGK